MLNKIVGVMGSGTDRWDEFSRPLGALIARMGFHLLTGGGAGVMEAVSEAFCSALDRKGRCLGVLPDGPPPGYPNPFVEITIRTPLPRFDERKPDQITRNSINVLSSDAIVALPGSQGTRNEIQLALKYGKPLRLFGPGGAFVGTGGEQAESIDEVERFLIAALGA